MAATGLLSLSAAPKRANVSDFADMAPYVYPGNTARYVSKPYFTPDGQNYLRLSDDGKRVVKHDIRNGAEVETLMDVTHTRQANISSIQNFTLSPDGSKLLIATSVEPIYRRSTARSTMSTNCAPAYSPPSRTNTSPSARLSSRPTDVWWHLWPATTISISRSSTMAPK